MTWFGDMFLPDSTPVGAVGPLDDLMAKGDGETNVQGGDAVGEVGFRAVRSEANEGLDELCLSVVMRARGGEQKEHDRDTEEGRKKIQQDARRLRFLIDGMALNILDNPRLYGLEELRGMIAEEIFG